MLRLTVTVPLPLVHGNDWTRPVVGLKLSVPSVTSPLALIVPVPVIWLGAANRDLVVNVPGVPPKLIVAPPVPAVAALPTKVEPLVAETAAPLLMLSVAVPPPLPR